MSPPAMWRPSTEDELRSTIDARGLEETHFFEVKELLPATPAGRKELARDLAQFSIDGGVLLIGVAEAEGQPGWSLAPTPLQGLSERIDQIARSTIDPPLTIRVSQFRATADDGTGYVVVEVPASPAAPHMVDGRYYGRGDKARYQLSDSEVERLHAARRTLLDEAGRLLDEEIARDPYPAELRRHGHLYLVAQPLRAAPDLAHELIDNGDVHRLLQFSGELLVERSLRQWAPAPASAGSFSRRAEGVAQSSHELAGPRQVLDAETAARREQSSVDLELRDDGGLRMFIGRATDSRQGDLMILDGLALAYASRIVECARSVAFQTGYYGPWLLGIAADGLAGGRSAGDQRFYSDRPAYSANTYRQTTTAEYFELDQQPGAIVNRLIGKLLRGLGTSAHYAAHIKHPTIVRMQNVSPGQP